MFLVLHSLGLGRDALVHGQRRLGLRPVKDDGDLLQRVALGLGEGGPYNDEHEEQEPAEDDVVVPADALHSYGVYEERKDEAAGVEVELQRQAFGAQGVREDLGGVLRMQSLATTHGEGRMGFMTYSKKQRRIGNIVVEEVHKQADDDDYSSS